MLATFELGRLSTCPANIGKHDVLYPRQWMSLKKIHFVDEEGEESFQSKFEPDYISESKQIQYSNRNICNAIDSFFSTLQCRKLCGFLMISNILRPNRIESNREKHRIESVIAANQNNIKTHISHAQQTHTPTQNHSCWAEHNNHLQLACVCSKELSSSDPSIIFL